MTDKIEGMTLRDWFAGQALAFLAHPEDNTTPRQSARNAYAIADAMIAERKGIPRMESAAPRMLEVLKDGIDVVETKGIGFEYKIQQSRFLKAARAAIAKAEGRE